VASCCLVANSLLFNNVLTLRESSDRPLDSGLFVRQVVSVRVVHVENREFEPSVAWDTPPEEDNNTKPVLTKPQIARNFRSVTVMMRSPSLAE
jgi:hypothetical protein